MKSPLPRKIYLLFAAGSLVLLTGMGIRGGLSEDTQLRPEVRLKIYNHAISHFEKARAHYEMGRRKEALKEIWKATREVSAFPEAYDLARTIYQELGDEKGRAKAEALYKQHSGDKGASLYKLRAKVADEIRLRRKFAPPPDFNPVQAYVVSAVAAFILILGMVYEYHRLSQVTPPSPQSGSIFLAPFPSDRETEVSLDTWFMKFCVLALPAPFIFSLMVLLGFRYYSDILAPFFLMFLVTDVVLYLVFFADLTDLGVFRRPPRMR